MPETLTPLPATLPPPEAVGAAAALAWAGADGPWRWDGTRTVRIGLVTPDDPVRFAPGEVVTAGRRAVRALAGAVEAWDRVGGPELEFARSDGVDIRVGFAAFPEGDGKVAWTVIDPQADGTIREAEVWLDGRLLQRLDRGDFGFLALLHELGHALGLGHPDGGGSFAPFDARDDTVMSERPASLARADGRAAEPATPMVYDIAALQTLYGPPEAAARDDRHRLDRRTPQLSTLWDGGGHDLLDGGALRADAVLDLREGGRSRFTAAGVAKELYVAFGTVIEDARAGRGDDLVIGNAAANRLWGGAGDDRLVGLAGDDRLAGGRGDDRLEGGGGDDRLVGGRGEDLLWGGAGDDLLLGGKGHDVAVFSGRAADHLLERAGRAWVVEDLAGDGGRDVLRGVETVVFDDAAFTLQGHDLLPLARPPDLDALLAATPDAAF